MPNNFGLSSSNGSVLYDVDCILQRYDHTLFCVPDDFSADPTFGIGIQQFIGESITPATSKLIKIFITNATEQLFPEIKILNIVVTSQQQNTFNIELTVNILPYGAVRQITKAVQ